MAYQVTAPMVQVQKTDGSHVHVEEGGRLPDDVSEASLDNLIALGFLDEVTDGDGKPTARAGVKAWREYAVTQGMTEEAAAAASKDELVELYSD
jgi:hypothetical protein